MAKITTLPGRQEADLVVLSHLRWNLVFQRPQHLMTRAVADRRVFYVEEPLFGDDLKWQFETHSSGVLVCTPCVRHGAPVQQERELIVLMDLLFSEKGITAPVLWYYTPMALPSTRHLERSAVVYDCMDELSLFQGAPPGLLEMERQLMAKADVVFTGGHSLYEHKKAQHRNIHAVPSSIDAAHFGKARGYASNGPADQAGIPGPRFGFFGVIDERMDIELLRELAALRPEIHLVIIGPVVKIHPDTLPVAPNIHYPGARSYDELPGYIAGWDGALMPFALNDSTRFISPTKTPEYLAAGRPVISTPIKDVIFPYAAKGLVRIASDAQGFAEAMDAVLALSTEERSVWSRQVDAHLSKGSWDSTWAFMRNGIAELVDKRSKHISN